MCRMNVKIKLSLMKQYKSYWNVLPEEMQILILSYKDSQELVDRRESRTNQRLCRQIRDHGLLCVK